MKRTLLVMVALAALVFSTMAGASPNAKWDSQVTGGGEFVAGSTYFDLAVSSRTTDDTTKGMFQYTRDGLVFHGVVDCLYIDGYGNVTMSGDVKDQEGFWAEYGAVSLSADGTKVRVHVVSPGADNCGHSTSWGATLVEGSFNLRL